MEEPSGSCPWMLRGPEWVEEFNVLPKRFEDNCDRGCMGGAVLVEFPVFLRLQYTCVDLSWVLNMRLPKYRLCQESAGVNMLSNFKQAD